tara:strand:+ start:4199 stop:5581 length:1383 start_codon:yes stop_codon:yes gene_type:complete
MMQANIEQTILRNLLTDEKYMRKVLPFIKPDYFQGVYKTLFKEAGKYVAKYNKLPSSETMSIQLGDAQMSEEQFGMAMDVVPNLFSKEKIDYQWLLDHTEKWCQDRAIYISIMESISIIDGKHETLTKNSLPELLQKALGVAFDTNVGHDYVEQAEERWDFYHTEEDRIPFDLSYFNKITKGGVPKKTLNIALAGTGVGKSLFMCHVGAAALVEGKNVLYITMEMAEEKIAERIDANLLNVPIDQLDSMSKDMFTEKVKNLARKTTGRLIVKEYPTGSAHAGHFRALLNELKLKKQFEPDIIFVDYLNICASSRMKAMGGSINSYTYIKAIAEELRGLAVEFNLPIFSATQTTRSGYGNSDVGLEDTSESFGLPATADLMFALISTEELEKDGQMMVKQLKNRYNDPTMHKRFVVGVDRAKMRLYDVEETQQTLVDDTPVFDKSSSGDRISAEKFGDFKL